MIDRRSSIGTGAGVNLLRPPAGAWRGRVGLAEPADERLDDLPGYAHRGGRAPTVGGLSWLSSSTVSNDLICCAFRQVSYFGEVAVVAVEGGGSVTRLRAQLCTMATVDEDLPADAVVEAGWQAVRDDGRVRAELVEAAYAEPRLRQLYPWTGMGELHFSRCTQQRWTWDIPYIQPAAGGAYWVSGPTRTQTVGPAATAQEAIAMVVERLPPGSGPAFVGTPEELAAYEAKTRPERTD